MVVVPSGSTDSSPGTTIRPTGPVVKPGLPITINTTQGYLSVPNAATSMFPNATATGSSPAEQFMLTSATGASTNPVLPGTTSIVQSVATGLYCRVVPSTTAGVAEIKCDQLTPDTATPMTYTGSGLLYNGTLLGTSGPGQPATFGSVSIDPSQPSSGSSVAGTGVDAMLITPGGHSTTARKA